MTVHSTLGNGFQEVIYQRALEIEMALADIAFRREFEMQILYREEFIGTRRVDFLVEGVVSVELKALIQAESFLQRRSRAAFVNELCQTS
jgi:GxxExxY protein